MAEHLKYIAKIMFSYHEVRSQREHKEHHCFGDETFITTVIYEGLFSALLQRQGESRGNSDFLILHLMKSSFSFVHCNVLVQHVGIFQTFQEFF